MKLCLDLVTSFIHFIVIIVWHCFMILLLAIFRNVNNLREPFLQHFQNTFPVSLSRHTSHLVQLFNDKLPISSLKDHRLKQLNKFYHFMLQWREETKEHNGHFISSKLWFDLQSMCIGFVSMVAVKLTKYPESVIKPAIVNQDCVEKHFCQVRACNGQNNNPTYHQQESTQNYILFRQSTISRKSNAGLMARKGQLTTCSLP